MRFVIRELQANDGVWAPTLGEAADRFLAHADAYPKPIRCWIHIALAIAVHMVTIDAQA